MVLHEGSGNRRLPAAGAPQDGGSLEAATFVFGAAGELAQLARQHRLDVLAYLLDMAQLEAQEAARRLTQDKL